MQILQTEPSSRLWRVCVESTPPLELSFLVTEWPWTYQTNRIKTQKKWILGIKKWWKQEEYYHHLITDSSGDPMSGFTSSLISFFTFLNHHLQNRIWLLACVQLPSTERIEKRETTDNILHHCLLFWFYWMYSKHHQCHHMWPLRCDVWMF